MGEQIETFTQPARVPARSNTRTWSHLAALCLALGLGALGSWQLRLETNKNDFFPWLLLLIGMFIAAYSLRQLDLWLPGEPILPRLAVFPPRARRLLGAVCIVAALALTAVVVIWLLPDYRKWQGAPTVWLAALALVVLGAWLVGAVGRGSPRAATALTLWRDTRRNRWREVGAFILILALAIFLRTYRFDTIPPGIYVDETNGALDALYILEGRDASPFGTGWYGTPNGYIYYMAGLFQLLGANWTSLKVISLIPAILTVPAVYLLGRLLFGPSAGLIAMLLLAASRWHLSMSRWGWNETAPPLFQVLAFFFLIRGLRDRHALDYALSGLLMSLAIYTYLSARLAALTLVLYVVYWFLSDPTGWRASLRRSWLGIVLVAAAALVAIGPITVTFVTDPFTFNNRVNEISILRDIREQASLTPLLLNLGDMFKFFHQTGDLQGKHNLPGEPMADSLTGLLFAVGLAYSILAWRDQRRILLLAWLVIGLAGNFLSSHHESPQSYRTLTALPAVVLIAADVLDRLVRATYRGLREQPFLASRPLIPAFAAGGVALLTLVGVTLWESGVYFGRQASSIATLRGFNAMENRVAAETLAALERGEAVYLSPAFAEFSPLRFLTYGVFKTATGKNTLDERPYHIVELGLNLPLADTGQDVLMLVDSNYWFLRDYIAWSHPDAQMELVRLEDNLPIYMRIKLPHPQVAVLQGLTKRVTFSDGQQDEQIVSQIEVGEQDARADEITWEGSILLERGGAYEFHGEGGLQVYLDGQQFEGQHYLGRGRYGLRVVRSGEAGTDARLTLKFGGNEPVQVPPKALFRVPPPQQGLLATYYPNTDWEGDPLFSQVTPFLMLAWLKEQPLAAGGQFSAHYSGTLLAPESRSYTFRIESDDGARLILDGILVGESLVPGTPQKFEVTTELSAGEHPIQIDYFQQGGGGDLRLYWKYAKEEFTPVPPSALVPDQP